MLVKKNKMTSNTTQLFRASTIDLAKCSKNPKWNERTWSRATSKTSKTCRSLKKQSCGPMRARWTSKNVSMRQLCRKCFCLPLKSYVTSYRSTRSTLLIKMRLLKQETMSTGKTLKQLRLNMQLSLPTFCGSNLKL